MSNSTFVNKVKQYFKYLEAEYGFKVIKEENSDIRPQTDGVVEYASDSMVIVIDSDRGVAALWFYRIKDGRKYYLNPVGIHEYINTTIAEKKLLLSTNPQDYDAATVLFNQKLLLSQPGWKLDNGTTDDKLELRLRNYSEWLKKHANECLKNDFSRWPEFYEYKVQRARADLLRRGDDEEIFVAVKDSNGNVNLVKQSALKDQMEHVEKLKREFLS